MIRYTQIKEMLDKKINQREYNDVLKQMGVMSEDGKVDLQNMKKKIGDFLEVESNRTKFLKEVEENDIEGEKVKIRAKKLNPGQTTIYLDQIISRILSNAEFVKDVIKGKYNDRDILISSDNYIIDGHHRWGSVFILNPKCKIKCTKINLPIEKALPILNAILKEYQSRTQDQTGEQKYNLYKLAKEEKLPDKLQKIIKKMADEDPWRTGKDKTKMVEDLYEKIFHKDKKKLSPTEYLAKNIKKIPSPHSEFTERKEMPQLKKKDVEKIVKEKD